METYISNGVKIGVIMSLDEIEMDWLDDIDRTKAAMLYYNDKTYQLLLGENHSDICTKKMETLSYLTEEEKDNFENGDISLVDLLCYYAEPYQFFSMGAVLDKEIIEKLELQELDVDILYVNLCENLLNESDILEGICLNTNKLIKLFN